MAKFSKGYMLESIVLDGYTKKSTGEKEVRKECHFLRMEQSEKTGKWLPALRNTTAIVSMFPKRYSMTTGELVDDTIYRIIDQYKDDLAPIAVGKLDVDRPFNFETDGEGALPRTSITVSTEYDKDEDDSKILDRLVNNAKYQLRGLGIGILVDGVVKATSHTAIEYAKAKADGEERGKALKARLAKLKAEKEAAAKAEPKEKELSAEQKLDAELEEHLAEKKIEFKKAGLKGKELLAAMDAAEEEFLATGGEVNKP